MSVADIANRTLAQQGLIDFAKRCSPGFQAPKHVLYLADLLERVERGEITRLAISAPPGSGKSTLLQCFVAWFLGRDSARRVLAISATESLAKRNSRATQTLVTSDAWPFGAGLRGESVLEWSMSGGGEVRAIGRNGNVTGFRAELCLVDDLQSDAGSEQTRASDEQWFREVLSTRLEPSGVCVVIQTRWSDDDIIGRLIEGESSDQWHVVNIPALADDFDVLGREPGEALWPERWPVELLEKKKREIGSLAFAAQYQGDPVPAGGAIFAPEWFEHRYDTIPTHCQQQPERDGYNDLQRFLTTGRSTRPPMPLIRLQAIDCAAKTGIHNDRTVVATVATDLVNVYIEDVWFGRVPFTELKRKVPELYERFEPRTVYVEEASNGYALLDELRASTTIPITGIKPGTDSKEARAESVTGWFESGRILFPRHAPWLQETLAEFLRFPHGRHDDIVDAIVLAVKCIELTIKRHLSDRQHRQQLRHLKSWMSR